MNDPINYIRKDDKLPYDPTEYIVLYEDLKDRNDFDDWEFLSWIGGAWVPLSRQKAWEERSNSKIEIPDKFPMRIRRIL